MQLWLAVKNVLPLHLVPAQPGTESNRSNIPFAKDLLLETSTLIALTKIPCWPFPFVMLFWTLALNGRSLAGRAISRPSEVFPLKML